MSGLQRLAGIDHGAARIGVALSDPLGITARPVAIVTGDAGAALDEIAALIDREMVGKVVVGLPTDSQGLVGGQATEAIRWARTLADRTAVPIVLWDESYSSAEAKAMARRAHRRPDEPLDDFAATAILQDYLDAGGATGEPGRTLESFSDVE